MVTEIVVEIVSNLYSNEEKAMSLTLSIMNKVIKPELKSIALDAIEEYQIFRENSNNAYNQDTSMNFSIANSEIYYAPRESSHSEFLEIINAGSGPASLDGVSLSDGVEFEFSVGTELAPGERIILVSDKVAFAKSASS